MLIVWLVATLSAGLIATCLILLRPDLRAAPRAWQLLAGSGIPLALGGLGFTVRFWTPLPGPYLANAVLYRTWATEWPRSLTLYTSALILLAHFGLSAAGFIGTARMLWRQHRGALDTRRAVP